jgi:HAD superfamily hydrolase (TIGR01509 family)
MTKAVVFDFDGVIAETEPIQLEAYNKLLDQFNVPPLSEATFIREYVGLPSLKIVEHLSKKFNIPKSAKELAILKETLYEKLLEKNSLKKRSGLVELLEQLKRNGWHMAIASSSPTATLNKLLSAINVDEYFWPVLSSDSVSQGKPAPDIYELAVTRLGLAKTRVVAIEDSNSGLSAAKKAGLKCVAVPNRFTMDHDFSQADFLSIQLENLSHEKLISLIQKEIVYVPKSASGYCHVLLNTIRRLCSNSSVKIHVKNPIKDESILSQLAELEELYQDPPDALILVPVSDTQSIRRTLLRIASQGTVIVPVDQEIKFDVEVDSRPLLKSCCVAADCQKGGEIAAKALLKAIEYKGSIGIVSGPRNIRPSKDRRLGVLDHIASYAPQVRLEVMEYTNWYREEGLRAAEGWIRNGILLDGIFCACDNLAMAVADAYQNAETNGRKDLKKPAIVGFDGIPEVYEYILDDRITATIEVNIGYQGRAAFRAATEEIDRGNILVTPSILTKTDIRRDRNRTRCFISYSHTDSAIAQKLCKRLSSAGFHTVFDTERIAVGERFSKICREEINNSKIFLILLSKEAVESKYVIDELEFAVNREARRRLSILPIRVKIDCDVPVVIQDHNYLDLSHNNENLSEKNLSELIRTIDKERKLTAS